MDFSKRTLRIYFYFIIIIIFFFLYLILIQNVLAPLSGVLCSSFSIKDESVLPGFLYFHIESGSIVIFIIKCAGTISLAGVLSSSHSHGPLQNSTRQALK